MNEARHYFLAGARLSHDEHRAVRRRDAARKLEEALGACCAADGIDLVANALRGGTCGCTNAC